MIAQGGVRPCSRFSRRDLPNRNPVKRGLVEQPDQWPWSSFRAYYYGERGLVRVNFQEWTLEIKARPVEKFTDESGTQRPLIRKVRE